MFHWEVNGLNMNLFFDTGRRSLPIYGWIHSCISCTTPTGNCYSYYKDNHLSISVSICRECIRNNLIPRRGIDQQIKMEFGDLELENN